MALTNGANKSAQYSPALTAQRPFVNRKVKV